METPRLRLVQISPAHLEGFHRIWSSPEAVQWSSRGVCATLEDSEKWMSGLLPSQNPDGENFAVLLRSDSPEGGKEGEMIGVLGVYRSVPLAELGYTFHPSSWGKGYATEAVRAFVDGFWSLRPGVERMVAMTDGENGGSIGVLRKCGFVEVERERLEVTMRRERVVREAVTFEVRRPGGEGRE